MPMDPCPRRDGCRQDRAGRRSDELRWALKWFAENPAEAGFHVRVSCGAHLSFIVTDMPSPDGATIEDIRFGLSWMAARKSGISLRLLTTLCARNRPRGRRRGSTSSRNRL